MGIIILRQSLSRALVPPVCLWSGSSPFAEKAELQPWSWRMRHLLPLDQARASNQTTEIS